MSVAIEKDPLGNKERACALSNRRVDVIRLLISVRYPPLTVELYERLSTLRKYGLANLKWGHLIRTSSGVVEEQQNGSKCVAKNRQRGVFEP